MTDYKLYLESGPKRRKTMVHVLQLMGCIANGPTTEAALAATPEAIRAYLRFLARHGEAVEPEEAIGTVIEEHRTEGQFLGQGSPDVTYPPDLEPLDEAEIEKFLRWFGWMRQSLASWAESQSDDALDAAPEQRGRPARRVLLHVLGGPGGYLSTALGGVKGFSTLDRQAERGEVPLAEALRREEVMAAALVRAATPEQRGAVIQRANKVRTLRRSLRRMLEHEWEHLAELSRRPGGPRL